MKTYCFCTNPKCSFNVVDDYERKFCNLCGSPVARKCPECDHYQHEKGFFCELCGTPLRKDAEQPTQNDE